MNTSVRKSACLCGVLATGLVLGVAAETVQTVSGFKNTSRWESMFTEASGSNPDKDAWKGYYYTDSLAPHADADYDCSHLMSPAFVANSTTNHTFGGKSCTVGHVSLFCYAPNQVTFPRDGLIMKSGADFRDRVEANNSYIINGKILFKKGTTYIKKTTGKDANKNNRVAYLFTGPFSSESTGSTIQLPHYNSYPGLLDLQLGGDVSDFTGTIEVNPTLGTNWLSFVGTDQTFPGKVKLTRNAELRSAGFATSLATVEVSDSTSVLRIAATNDLTIGKLTLAAGKTLQVVSSWAGRHAGHLILTDVSAIAGTLAFTADAPTVNAAMLTNSTGKCAILTVPAGFGNFTVECPTLPVRDFTGTLPELDCVTETDGETKTVYLTHKKIIMNVKAFGDKKDLLTNGEYWSDGEPLTNSAAIYWIGYNASCSFSRDYKPYTNAFKDITFVCGYNFAVSGSDFEAKRLQMIASGDSGAPLYVTYAGRVNTVRDIVGGKAYSFPNVSTFTADSIEFVGDPTQTRGVAIQSYDSHFLNFRGPMTSSDCNIHFKARGIDGNGRPAPGGYIYFENGMQGFTGRLISQMVSNFNDWDDRSSEFGSKWVVSKTSNLGAPRPSFTFDALKLQYLNGLYNLCDVTLDEPTRGIYVTGGTADNAVGFIVTPVDTTLTIKQAIRMNGRLKKEGAGTLVLAQAEAQKLTFTSSGVDTPVEKTNVFRVQEGRLKVTTKFAADGFALTFTNGTSLVVANGATVDTALYNVKGSIASECTGALTGKIPVSVDPSGASVGDALTGVICTVASSSDLTVESFAQADAKPFGKGASYALRVTESSDDDGNKVFTATFVPRGVMIFLK